MKNLFQKGNKEGGQGGVALDGLRGRFHRVTNEAFVVFIGDDGAVLSYIKNNRVDRRLFTPSPDSQNVRAMLDVLNIAPSAPVYVLLDVLDQQYIRQSFPPVSSLSLKKIVQRRLDRDLPADDIKGALQLGRDEDGRREWNYMLLSATNTPDLQGWLDLLMECENRFGGVHLVPIEAMKFIRNLRRSSLGSHLEKQPPAWQILFMHTKVGGFRQVVLHHGDLVFTRLSQVTDESNTAFVAGSVEQEIQNTLDYLRRFDLEDNGIIESYVVIAPEVKDQVDMNRFKFKGFMLLTPHEVSQALGLDNAALFADTYGDIVLSHAFLQAPPVKKLIPPYCERVVKLEFMLRATKVAAIGLVALLLFLSGQAFTGYIGNVSQQDAVRTEQKQLQERLNKLTKIVDGQVEDVKIANSVTGLLNHSQLSNVAPLEFIRELAPHLTKDVLVKDIDWKKIKINRRISQVRGPSDLEVRVSVDFVGDYADDVAYADAANALYDKLRAGMKRYEVTATGLPGAGGTTAQLEINFDKNQANAARKKPRSALFTFRGYIEPPR